MFGNGEGRKTGTAIRSTLYLSVSKPEELSGWTASETSVEDHSSSSSFRASRTDFYARLQAGTDKQAKWTNTSKRTTERQTRTQTRTQTSRIILEQRLSTLQQCNRRDVSVTTMDLSSLNVDVLLYLVKFIDPEDRFNLVVSGILKGFENVNEGIDLRQRYS